MMSIGIIGLIKGIDTFDIERNYKLATYLARCIENEILMFLRKQAKHKNTVSLDEPINVDYEGNELLYSDVLSTQEDMEENIVNVIFAENIRMNMVNLLEHLNKR